MKFIRLKNNGRIRTINIDSITITYYTPSDEPCNSQIIVSTTGGEFTLIGTEAYQLNGYLVSNSEQILNM